MASVERRDDVEEMVRVAVGDQDGVDVAGRHMLLQSSERAGSRVEPEIEGPAGHEVTAALTRRSRPRSVGTQDREPHGQPPASMWTAFTCASSLPTKSSAWSRNGPASPVVRNSWCGGSGSC